MIHLFLLLRSDLNSWSSAFRLNSGDQSHQNRSLGDEQLDDSIVSKHRQKPILAPRCLGSAAFWSRVRLRSERQAINQSLVLQGQGSHHVGQGKDDMYHCESAILTRKIQIRHHPSDAKGNTLRYAIFKACVVKLTMHSSQNG